MKKSILIILAIGALTLSCSDSKSSEATVTATEKNQEIPVVANRMLTLEIEGMTCVMGCGGSIRSELAETKAIESCEFDFEQGRDKNIAKIAFDKDKITVDKIIDIVAKMNKGQFSVGKNSSEDIVVNIKTRVEEKTTTAVPDPKLNVQTSSATYIALPNFVEILASFFHN
jgi:mercuric ion binding protein